MAKKTYVVKAHERNTKHGRVRVKSHIRNNRKIGVVNDTPAHVEAYRLENENGDIQDGYTINMEDRGVQQTIISDSSEPLESIDVEDVGGALRVIEFEQDGDTQTKVFAFSDTRIHVEPKRKSKPKKHK